jgi:hypothetical protein
MSDSFDLEEQIARIRRAREESEKFVAEQKKLTAEHDKLFAEALKLQRDRLLSPWLLIAATIGGLGGLTAGVATIVNLLRAAH